jgi:gliding motility-associated-like protein
LKRKDLFLFLLLLIISFTKTVYSQTSISGIINQYTAVDSIYPTKDTIEVRNPAFFSADDTVMVYQAKGADVRTDTTSDGSRHLFGTFASINSANNAGNYEIILIEKVIGNLVIFKVGLNNTYDTEDIVQLITVPAYISASVDAELTCKNWVDSTGGVLVLMVSDTLFLNADINVSGKGFRGAQPYLSNGECASTDFILYKSYYFGDDADTISAGFKGEGVSKFHPAFRKGLGRWANGGGGGNGRFTGGGGGGSAGNGGNGGAEDTTVCSITSWPEGNWKGLGGNDGYGLDGIIGTINDSTIFLGGGGGAGTYSGVLTASNGGNGGGIVIIIATNIKTSGHQIIANGETVTSVATASAGGAGAGGVVVFDIDTIVGDISVYCNGGNGGNSQFDGKSGPGGGGGGGVVFWKKLKPDNVTVVSTSGGEAGYVQELYPGTVKSYTASDGNIGSKKNNVKTPLTGFLYNSIIANQNACWGYAPTLLEGSSLRGGTGTYTYQWQSSPDDALWTNIPGAINSKYQPEPVTDTIYYRRIGYSGPIIDYGNSIKVNVHASIVNNNIFGDDVLTCINNVGDTILGTKVTAGGDNISYDYIWQLRLDSDTWSDFTSAETNDTTMFPGIISDTTFVRRIVVSGACRDTVAPPIEITAFAEIDNNIITAVDEICFNDDPATIIGNTPVNGDGSYLYQWQERTNSTSWTDISGAVGKDFDPPNLTDTTYYKRFVYSDDCFDESEADTIIVLSVINNNIITTTNPTSTCYNTQKLVEASIPTGGKNIYDYKWEESPDGFAWSDVSVDGENQDYTSYNLITKTYFRRHVKSGACENTSANIEVTIDPLPIAVLAEFTDTVCSNTDVDLEFTITTGSENYILTYNDGENDFPVSGLLENSNIITINPTTISESKDFNFTIVSVEDQNGCFATDIAGTVDLTVYGNPQANPGINEDNCSLNYQLKAIPTLGSGIWSEINKPENGITVFDNVVISNSNINVSEAGEYTYQWKETNWNCVDSSNVEISFYDQLEDVDAGKEFVKLFYIDEYTLSGTYINPDGESQITSTWERVSDNDGEIVNPQSAETDIINLFDNTNKGIVITWTIQKGVCQEFIDTVTLKLEEVYTPTGFTPNGDGVNDYLKFLGLENAQSNKLIIYNRWGAEVYSTSNFSNEPGWNGTNNDENELPEDTYYYILNVVSKNGSKDNYKGYIVIKRF